MYEWIGKVTKNQKFLKVVMRSTTKIPRIMVYFLCHILGLFCYLTANRLRNRIIQNMAAHLSDFPRVKIHSYCRKYFFNFLITLYEILSSNQTLGKRKVTFDVQGEYHIINALQDNRGVILFAPHIGNFFYYYWYLTQKFDCLTIVTAGSDELRPLYENFQELGCKGLDFDTTPPLQLIKKLKLHLKKNGVVMIFGDFYRPIFPPSIFMDKETHSPSGAAFLALEENIPVIPFYGYRIKETHRIVYEKPIYLSKRFRKHLMFEASCELNQILEKMIFQVPDQWLYWFNVDERWDESGQKRREKGGGKDG